MGRIVLPKILTPAVLRAVAENVRRCFDEWVSAEQHHAPAHLQAQLQQSYERANAAYKEALDRADREGVHGDS